MNKAALIKILPNGFKNSKFDKNTLSLKELSIEMSVRFEQSTFGGLNNEIEPLSQTVIIAGIGIYDKYSPIFEQGFPTHIMDASLNNHNEMINLAGYDKVKHWNNDDDLSIT